MRWGVGQILAVPFVDTENTLLSSAENTTEVIKLILLAFCKSAIGLCFQKSAIILPELTSHTLALPSLDEVTILVPSKEKSAEKTSLVCPLKSITRSPDITSHKVKLPPAYAVAMLAPSGEKITKSPLVLFAAKTSVIKSPDTTHDLYFGKVRSGMVANPLGVTTFNPSLDLADQTTIQGTCRYARFLRVNGLA
jgi:hypothetical protein